METKLRGAIVGYGFIGSSGHLPAYAAMNRERRDVSIVAIADGCKARRDAARRDAPDARIYEDHEALLMAEGDRLDFIDIATPPYAHAPIAHAALARGLHVLCEKPLTTTAADARDLLQHAQKVRRVLFPCHNYLHAPVVSAVRDVLNRDLIGPVKLVTLQTFRTTHARGVADWRPDWRRELEYSGGGIAMDHGSHTFYLAFDWLGGYPHTVTAKMSAMSGATTEDNFSCALDFPGGLATAHLSWTAGARMVNYTIHGDRGAVVVLDDELHLVWTNRGSTVREKSRIGSDWDDASHTRWFSAVFDSFRKAIKSHDFTSKPTEDALLCMQVIEAAYASADARSLAVAIGREPS